MATPTQRPRCSAPARTRSSRMATGTLCRATRADRHRPPAAGVRRDTAEKLGQSHRESGAYAAAVAQALTFGPSFTTFSRRHRAPRPHYCSCALAPARPSAEHDAPDRPLLSAHSCACAAVPLRHARRGRTNPCRGHAHVIHDAQRMHLSRALSRTSRVALQAKPLTAATLEVRSLALRVGVGGFASEPPAARARFWGLFCVRNQL